MSFYTGRNAVPPLHPNLPAPEFPPGLPVANEGDGVRFDGVDWQPVPYFDADQYPIAIGPDTTAVSNQIVIGDTVTALNANEVKLGRTSASCIIAAGAVTSTAVETHSKIDAVVAGAGPQVYTWQMTQEGLYVMNLRFIAANFVASDVVVQNLTGLVAKLHAGTLSLITTPAAVDVYRTGGAVSGILSVTVSGDDLQLNWQNDAADITYATVYMEILNQPAPYE